MRISLYAAAAAFVLFVTPAWAAGSKGPWAFGKPGKEADVTRTVEVIADDRDGMTFKMDLPEIRMSETIKFVVTNAGKGDHEFSVGDTAAQRAHAKLMAKNPQMHHHDDPTTIMLAPGETKTLIWTFNKPVRGDVIFACQMPGHYDGGMVHKSVLKSGKAGAVSS